jgi:FAD/FMN-containing dehydrogenase
MDAPGWMAATNGSRAPAELEVMRSVKRALDPANILNPGKIMDL